jgi:ATP-dependent Clp protease, protease subunit
MKTNLRCECQCKPTVSQSEMPKELEGLLGGSPDQGPEVSPLELSMFALDRQFDFATRTIFINGEIDGSTFARVQVGLLILGMTPEPIVIQINSQGGSVSAATGIVGLMKTCPNPIITEGHGQIASAAVLILAAGDIRVTSEYCWIMHHCSQYGLAGRHTEVKASVAQSEAEEKMWAKWMEKFTKKPAKFWLEKGSTLDFYFTPAQAKEMGLIDKILPTKAKPKKAPAPKPATKPATKTPKGGKKK